MVPTKQKYLDCSSVGSSIYTPGYVEVRQRFNVSTAAAFLPLALYVLGLAVGPVLAAPISETHGRKIVYLTTFPPAMFFTLGAALAQNFATLLICRLLAGTFSAPSLAVGAGSMSDMYASMNRALASAIFIFAPMFGPAMGPVIGAYATQNLGKSNEIIYTSISSSRHSPRTIPQTKTSMKLMYALRLALDSMVPTFHHVVCLHHSSSPERKLQKDHSPEACKASEASSATVKSSILPLGPLQNLLDSYTDPACAHAIYRAYSPGRKHLHLRRFRHPLQLLRCFPFDLQQRVWLRYWSNGPGFSFHRNRKSRRLLYLCPHRSTLLPETDVGGNKEISRESSAIRTRGSPACSCFRFSLYSTLNFHVRLDFSPLCPLDRPNHIHHPICRWQ